MLHILRQSALTLVFTAGLYATLLALSFVVAPPVARKGWMDVWNMDASLFTTAPKFAYLGRDELDTMEPKVLLIGASNTGAGLRQGDVQALVPCAKVSNLALGGANISEMRELVDLIDKARSQDARRSDTIVLGIWYGMFVDSGQNWPAQNGDTDLTIERYRYGFERRTETGPVAVLPPGWLHTGVTLIRPYLLLEKIARSVTSPMRYGLFGKPPAVTEADKEKEGLSAEGRTNAIAWWRWIMGPRDVISAGQVDVLRHLIEELLDARKTVVLVDMPIPTWHRDRSPWTPSYAGALQDTVARFTGRPHFVFVDTHDLGADDNFTDEVHPKPHLARELAARVAATLEPLVCMPGSSTREAASAENKTQ